MDEKDYEKRLMKCISDIKKYSEKIQLSILQMCDDKDLEPIVIYGILYSLIRKMEKADPDLKKAVDMAGNLITPPEDTAEMVELIKKKDAKGLSTKMFKSHYGEGKKATTMVCGCSKAKGAKKTKCYICKKVCYYDDSMIECVSKDAKKVCPKCTLENARDELTAPEIAVLELILENENERCNK